ncbi:MAG: rhomboid family intramembrane serine protease [Marinifilaceae bacterium]|jgi:membrane associated rhomboid family serine protease|nr:rhomboid family intramembrane serine protease [Marinifilaceae bacterium]
MNFNNINNQYSDSGIWDGIKNSYKSGSILTKIIYINIAVFVLVNLINLVFVLGNSQSDFIIDYLAVPYRYNILLSRPWTVLSYMFLHQDFFHILSNIIILYMFGKIFMQFFGSNKLLSIYLLGGIMGAVFYILAYNYFPVFHNNSIDPRTLGASASITAIIMASIIYSPNYQLKLLFIGLVRLKYIGLVVILLDLILIPKGNAGGHIAHLGGAFMGFLFAFQLKRGLDISAWLDKIFLSIASVFKAKPKFNVSRGGAKNGRINDYEYNKQKRKNTEELNKILEKISKSGYDSLNAEEKEILFKSSKK